MIIGKTTPVSQEEAQGKSARFTSKDHSTSLRHSETGLVDQVYACSLSVSSVFLDAYTFLGLLGSAYHKC